MEDYLSEKEQWEAIKSGIREYGLWIVAGVALGAAGLAGYRWYQGHLDSVDADASAEYMKLAQTLDRGDRAGASATLGELEREHASSPYLDQARLMMARVYVQEGNLDKAAQALRDVLGHTKDKELALVARLRLARVQIGLRKPDEAIASLNAVEPGAFVGNFHEARGDAYYAKGDKGNALKEYLAARAAGFVGDPSSGELELKISDLSSGTPPMAAQLLGRPDGAAPASPGVPK